MDQPTQNYANHARLVPLYHMGTTALLVLPTLYFAFLTATDFSFERLAMLAFAAGVILVGFFARNFPVGVQDRVIRLEERMRMERLLPEDLRSRIPAFTSTQLIGLRFASDAELPELARQVLERNMTDSRSIKQAVKDWRADHQRI